MEINLDEEVAKFGAWHIRHRIGRKGKERHGRLAASNKDGITIAMNDGKTHLIQFDEDSLLAFAKQVIRHFGPLA